MPEAEEEAAAETIIEQARSACSPGCRVESGPPKPGQSARASRKAGSSMA
jgi:hypothetical protein